MKYEETKQSRIGYLCLWYIRMCFQRFLITEESISEIEHEIDMLNNISLFILNPDNLIVLLLLDASTTLELMYLYFEPRTLELFSEFPD